MTFQVFITLLVIGSLVGLVSILTSKGTKATAPIHFIAAILGAFLGWLVFTQLRGAVLQVLFAVGGSALLLWIVRLIKKSK